MGYSPVRAGLAFLPMVLFAVLGATQIAARLLPHVPPRRLITPGLLCTAGGVCMFNTMTTHSSYVSTLLPTWALLGLGLGITTVATTNTVMNGTEPRDRGITAAFRTTSQQIGGSVGLALANTVAAGAITAYVAAHPSDGSRESAGEALVHGTAVAATWSSALLALGAGVVFLLVTHDPRVRRSPADGTEHDEAWAT
ncbi:MFS transporter [Streptomyces sp. NPDC058221]|uniref:MFS transporter n=1 Tax=Streptomyces sp. NPDC058221 TaxID=3346388 RepID=UPI0036E6DDE7